MVYQLAIVIIIPIFLGIVAVSPFETEIEEQTAEEIETPEDSDFRILYFLLGLAWIFFLFRLLRQIMKGTYKLRTRI
ncbi:MAG: hypothetical protein ACE5RJ_01765 [Nitrosopumilaceae archaeon]